MGVDNINEYYDVNLKYSRLSLINNHPNFIFHKCDISDIEQMEEIFIKYKIDYVINLAAQAGVRYSIDNPDAYIQSNVIGFYNILELLRRYPVRHLIYASSSSVYGANTKVPFEETDFVDHPVSLYAATKKTNELMAYTYSHLYDISATGLRFFTVYGPMGRPDMAYFSFTDKFFKGETINIYNNGDFDNDMYRDFTYIDDIVEGIIKLIDVDFKEKPRHRVVNIGNNKPEKLMVFIKALENALSKHLNRKVELNKTYEPIKSGDVKATYASTKLLEELVGFKPNTSINEGLDKFIEWYISYFKIKI
nr:GDP-mannose 4,6-dehydratase [Acholeplasma laidlawii]